jgi:hypothetical protein
VVGIGWLKGAAAAGITSAAVLVAAGAWPAALAAPARAAAPVPGSVQWSSFVAGTGRTIAVDPHNGDVFALGSTFLIAYDGTTGAKLWANGQGGGLSVAASPDGQTVFVIKSAAGAPDYSTSAFDAATGKLLWNEIYNGPANRVDRPTAIAVSQDSSAVFVTGTSQGKTSGQDYATVAYATANGRQLWASRYNGAGHSHDNPAAIAVSPDSSAVFVTGVSFGATIGSRFATVAYSAASGKPMWTKTYDKPSKRNSASSVAVSPDGHRVFVTGDSFKNAVGAISAVVAYAAGSGHQEWAQSYHAAKDGDDFSSIVLVSPRDGGKVIVAGRSVTAASADEYLAVAYSVTGQRRWAEHYNRAPFTKDFLGGATLSPDGRILYLTGSAFTVPGGEEPTHSLTIAAKVHQGTQIWSQRVTTKFTNQGGGPIGVSPGGSFIYIGVEDFTATTDDGFTTFALRA